MMRLFRMGVAVAALGFVTVAGAASASAQAWPGSLTRVIVPFSAGSATDIVPRIVFEQVQALTGKTFIIDNRPGGGFTVGVGAVKQAHADGATLLVHSNGLVTSPAFQDVNWDPVKDFSAVTPLGKVPMVLVVSPDKNIRTLKQLVDKAVAEPGSLNYATAGIGSPPHLAMERFRVAAGIKGQVVPFKGAAEALTEVAAGRVDCYFTPLAAAVSLIEAGKLVPLAVSSLTRAKALPDVPTTTEAGYPNSDFDFYVGVYVTKATPPAMIEQMNAILVKVLADPALQEKLAKVGAEAMPMAAKDFDARIAREAPMAFELAKAAGVTKP